MRHWEFCLAETHGEKLQALTLKRHCQKNMLNKHDSGTLISQRFTPCGEEKTKKDWEARCFFKSKIMGLAWAFLIDNSVSLVQL